MPELPEVETTRRGIAPHLEGLKIVRLVIREPRLRWPVPKDLPALLDGVTVESVTRRGKYLLLNTTRGSVILHLGMSGSLRVVTAATASDRHDHVDFVLANHRRLRLHDPRRFGAVLWGGRRPLSHPLLRGLGPEPLADGFDGGFLRRAATGRRMAVKPFLMDSHVVVGVGNIYASEALYLAGIHPKRSVQRIGRDRWDRLAIAVRQVLGEAIQFGGTTLRDFVQEDGRPGYFRNRLRVYDKKDAPCEHCGAPLRRIVLAQRSTFYCARCQH